MKYLQKILRYIFIGYYKLSSWLSITEKDKDLYVSIGEHNFMLAHQDDLENHRLKDYFKERKEFLILEQAVELFIHCYKFSGSLKGALVIYYDSNGKQHCLMHNYEKGFERLSDHERIVHLNTKKELKDKFNHQVYLLERI